MGKERETIGDLDYHTISVDLHSLEKVNWERQCSWKELHGACAKPWRTGTGKKGGPPSRFLWSVADRVDLSQTPSIVVCFVHFFFRAEKCSNQGYFEIKSWQCLIGAVLLREKSLWGKKICCIFFSLFSIPQCCFLCLSVKILSASNEILLVLKIIK